MTWPLELVLCDLAADEVRGTLEYNDRGILPTRMRRLDPEACESFTTDLRARVVVSDMFRSPESSLEAVRRKRGAQPPAYSAHNYGRAIDLDVKASLVASGIKVKTKFDLWMAERGWYCHRRDSRMRSEAWHYNYLGDEAEKYLFDDDYRTSAAIERLLLARYGEYFELTEMGAQQGLASLRLYGGEIDGIWGRLSKMALRVFQKAWSLKITGTLDRRTMRTLAYVSCLKIAC